MKNLYPNENQTVTLISFVLDFNNYHSWSKSMIFSPKNKVEFINGSLSQPSKIDVDYFVWYMQQYGCFWIIHFVSIFIRQSIIWMNSTIDIWDDLKVIYSQRDPLRVFDLQSKVSCLNQYDLFITKYFTKLKII